MAVIRTIVAQASLLLLLSRINRDGCCHVCCDITCITEKWLRSLIWMFAPTLENADTHLVSTRTCNMDYLKAKDVLEASVSIYRSTECPGWTSIRLTY